jgi:hypothetical protein
MATVLFPNFMLSNAWQRLLLFHYYYYYFFFFYTLGTLNPEG